MKKQILYLILILSVFFHKTTYSQKVYLPHYSNKNGLASNICYYGLQDHQGFIWIATDAGISRFDGSYFENFTVEDGLPDNQIIQIREDKKERIWLMALNGEISYFLKGKIHNKTNDKSLEKLNINAIVTSFVEDYLGNIWFGTNDNFIVKWNEKQTIIYRPKITSERYQNAYLYEDNTRKIHAVTPNASYVFQNNVFENIPPIAQPTNFKAINYQKNKGLYWIENNKLYQYDNNFKKVLFDLDKQFESTIFGYLSINKSNYWINSRQGSSVYHHNNIFNSYLNGKTVNHNLIDKDGNTWFLTNDGLYKLPSPGNQIIIYDKDFNSSFQEVKSICTDDNFQLWFGSNQTGLTIWHPISNKIKKVLSKDIFKSYPIKQIIYDNKFKQIFAANDYSLYAISTKGGNLIKQLNEKDNKQFVIKKIAIDTNSNLALALTSGVFILNNRNDLNFSVVQFKENKNYFYNRSYSVFFDLQQQLWFSNINGLHLFAKDNVKKNYLSNSLLSKRINDIAQLEDGKIALATDGYGVIILNDNKVISVLNKKTGLTANIIKKIVVYHNELWVLSNIGVNRIIFNEGKYTIQTLDELNGAFGTEIKDFVVNNDYTYFASNSGILQLSAQQLYTSNKAPQLFITSITSRDKPLNLINRQYILPAGEQNLIVNFSAIDFGNKSLTYKYRLKNNSPWIETKSKRLEFPSFEPGEYELEIAAKSQNSNWSVPIKINFIQKSFFFKSWWFISILILTGGAVIYKLTLNYSHRKRKQEQEQLVLQNKILTLEQKALQAMMNPHFVFNVMNSIQHFINTQDNSLANKVLTGFAKLIRKNLEMSAKGHISLSEELDYLSLYLSLEKNRFGNKLNYQFNIAENLDVDEITIPSMLLQPFVENALWHGIMPKENGGTIQIELNEENDYLIIKIIDDGIGYQYSLANKKNNHQSKGLNLIQERINLLNKIDKEPILFSILQIGKSGTLVTLKIPV